MLGFLPPPNEFVQDTPPLSPKPVEAESYDLLEATNDPEEEDEFLTQGWDATSSNGSASVTSSVYAHTFEHGRRYHAYKQGRYPIPNDDKEQGRDDMKHSSMLELTDGKLFLAPIREDPQKILDVGTGTGLWAIEVGDLYPGASVLGLDLSPIQPHWVPPNVRFMVDDVEDEWIHGSDWDLIHFRSMAVIMQDLQRVVDQAFKHLRPGGWIEFQEAHGMPFCDDGTMSENDVMRQYYGECQRAMALFGYDIELGTRVGGFLESAGFNRVTCTKMKTPLGMWARDKTMRVIGLYTREAVLHSVESVIGKPFAALGLSAVEREVWAAKVRASSKEDDAHRYYNFYFWYAQKPE